MLVYILRWKDAKEMEKVQEKYFKTIATLTRNTPEESVLVYILRWKDAKEMEKVQEKYFKTIVTLTRNTPDYLWGLEIGRTNT